ncbi:transmembrane protein 211 [Rana temporaria]|uniref:transmembrane protein 211 n=1 Tax=Rana temporaria TaxID=8407 RepID=UPI001AAD014D|nr:transmembrane protein 211 [Rana temporaria]XP_040207385.1 transmembrane protein 211 [Rana temporaria]
MVSCMGSLWVAFSFTLSLILGFSLLSSAWFKNDDISFGVFVQCSGQISTPCNQTCIVFRTLDEIPDLFWKIAAVILFAGWLLMSFGALLVLSWTIIPAGICQRRVCTPARYTQITAVVVTVLGLILFPLSLRSSFANRICDSSYVYKSGSCSLGWGYMMAIITVMLSCFLPIIGRYNLNEMKTKILRSKLSQRMLRCENHRY